MQVHRARLHDGREVAVKVQYPGLESAVTADLAALESLAAGAAFLFPNAFDFGWIVKELQVGYPALSTEYMHIPLPHAWLIRLAMLAWPSSSCRLAGPRSALSIAALQGIHSGFLRCSLAFRLMPNFANFEMWEAGVSQASAKDHESSRNLARSLSYSRELSAPWQLPTLRKSSVNSLLILCPSGNPSTGDLVMLYASTTSSGRCAVCSQDAQPCSSRRVCQTCNHA